MQWIITSLSVKDQDTTYNVEQIRDYQRKIKGYNYGKYVDTTIVIKDTSQSSIVLSRNNVKFNLPLYYSTVMHNVPNHSSVGYYPIYVPNGSLGDGNGGAYYDINGLNKYEFDKQGSHGYSSTEKLILIEFRRH